MTVIFYRFTLRHTKNGDSQTVPMTPEVYQMFTEL